MNCPIDPKTMEISGKKRIEESIPTIESLTDSKLVIASHQGRVGNTDYTSMAKHAAVLEEMLGRKIRYVEDTIGEAAQSAIRDLKDGEILMLDNLRLCAEENYEFLPEDAAKTIMVSRLWKLFDLCVLDSFPSAHRSHPSIVGFPNVIPACAGRIVEKEVRELDEILSVAKAPHVVVLGGSKVADRLEAISLFRLKWYGHSSRSCRVISMVLITGSSYREVRKSQKNRFSLCFYIINGEKPHYMCNIYNLG